MKLIKTLLFTAALCLVLTPVLFAQTTNVSETFKTHFNKTVVDVSETASPYEKRALLNKSFNKMLSAVERIESSGSLSAEELTTLDAFKFDIVEKSDELNGLNGFPGILDGQLDNFSKYTQQDMEQAVDRTITLTLGTVLLIILILLLI